MSVQKNRLMNIISRRSQADKVIRNLLMSSGVDFADAGKLIDESKFMFSASNAYADAILEMNNIEPFQRNLPVNSLKEKIEYICEIGEYKFEFNKGLIMDYHEFTETEDYIEVIFAEIEDLVLERDSLLENLEQIDDLRFVDGLKHFDVNFKTLGNLEHFIVKYGYFDKEAGHKLERNYENISAIFVDLDIGAEQPFNIIVYPKKLRQEMDRILHSASFNEVTIPEKFLDQTDLMKLKVSAEKSRIKQRLAEIKDYLIEFAERHHTGIDRSYSNILMEKQIQELSERMMASENFVYISVYVPEQSVRFLTAFLETLGCIITFEEEIQKEKRPNNKILSKWAIQRKKTVKKKSNQQKHMSMNHQKAEEILESVIELDKEISKEIFESNERFYQKISSKNEYLLNRSNEELEEGKRLTLTTMETQLKALESSEQAIDDETNHEIEQLHKFLSENKDEIIDKLFDDIISGDR